MQWWWGEWGETGKVVFLHSKQIENNTLYLTAPSLLSNCPNGNYAREAGV